MLVLDKLSAGYGSTQVLREVTMAVPAGSVVALLGANGAGKTTLLRTVSGLIKPMSGRVTLDGEDITGRAPHQLVARGLCHVPEGRGVFPALTVADNLLVQSPDGQTAEATELAIEAFPRLGQRLTQVAGTMSGGEQQMLALARAYVQSPSLVLLDEVSMGLAPKIVDEIFEFLERLALRGASLLLVEQYVTRALAVCDYVYLLNKGSVAFAGEPAELDAEEVFASYTGA
ncbi:ABC transporter ATP-binding protein [Nocardioides marmoriginsengisoli]|uniref:ABC transporter ATP-binding protein n=1 Tax=Nocardioides marmoriginsengisoli TaxID=661483 RepID=A0A3N0CCN9_9ACTN|nr:ABC transporter ATP-binding protein [Nocardioides marmoriginsengisoli]RNL61069.1 ABC transporter ATP-binding protein [Nocardioides marmoriginsengisoli]